LASQHFISAYLVFEGSHTSDIILAVLFHIQVAPAHQTVIYTE